MAACGSLHHIFDTLLPENPTLIESLSWNQIKPIEQSPSFTEIFGELHFKESPLSSPKVSTSSSIEINHTNLNSELPDTNYQTLSNSGIFSNAPIAINHTNRHKSSDSFSSLNSESLQLCTEGLGFESSDEVEDLKSGNGMSEWLQITQIETEGVKKDLASEDKHFSSYGECRRSRVSKGGYPPPISCIGRTGKPWVCFKSYRSNGRFVLKEIRIPKQEFLHAYREDGRLKLQFVQDDDEFLEEDEEEEEENDGEDDVENVDEGEENMGKENDDCHVTDHVNEEKEIEDQVIKTLDVRQEI